MKVKLIFAALVAMTFVIGSANAQDNRASIKRSPLVLTRTNGPSKPAGLTCTEIGSGIYDCISTICEEVGSNIAVCTDYRFIRDGYFPEDP